VPGVHGIDVLPGSRELAGVEVALAGEMGREVVLREVLDGLPYDAVVIDTPSNLGLLTVNALVASDVAVAPVAAGMRARPRALPSSA
jgi:chromosome partitioning protein